MLTPANTACAATAVSSEPVRLRGVVAEFQEAPRRVTTASTTRWCPMTSWLQQRDGGALPLAVAGQREAAAGDVLDGRRHLGDGGLVVREVPVEAEPRGHHEDAALVPRTTRESCGW